MKAAYLSHYGPPEAVQLKDIPKPVPKNNELLVKVVASAVTSGDARIRGARFPKGFDVLARLALGISGPRQPVLGVCFSGVIESVGKEAGSFKIGDEICGMTEFRMGTHAEYVTVRTSDAIAIKPAQITHEEAAGMLFGGTTALFFLRDKLGIRPSQTILINGASGAVGTNAVQLAKYFGAEVTAVTSGDNQELAMSLGATHVIDYTKQPVETNSNKYDVVFDAVGTIPISTGLKLLKTEGRLALLVGSLGELVRANFDKRIVAGTATGKKADIEFLLKLMTENKLKTIIEHVYPLEKIAQAYTRVDTGRKKGNVLVKMI